MRPSFSTLLRKRKHSVAEEGAFLVPFYSPLCLYHLAWRLQLSHWNTNLSNRCDPEARYISPDVPFLFRANFWLVSCIKHSKKSEFEVYFRHTVVVYKRDERQRHSLL